jgi:hypothetical protein
MQPEHESADAARLWVKVIRHAHGLDHRPAVLVDSMHPTHDPDR